MLGWDAEQTYLQTAIGVMVLDSMRVFNRERPVVQNTYQSYLKVSLGSPSEKCFTGMALGALFACLCVRGHDPILRNYVISRQNLRNITSECYQVELRNYVISRQNSIK